MEQRPLGRTGLEVSCLGLGTLTFGQSTWGTDAAAADRIVGRFLEAGGNLLDTADVYNDGRTEEILGRALAGKRDRVVLATKVGGPTGAGINGIGLSRKHIVAALEASLRRLRTDHVDLYQVHAFDPTVRLEETLSTLDDCVRAGKARYLGCSNYAAWHLMKANALAAALGTARFESLQPHYSLVCRHIEREHVPLCLEEKIALLPWSPLACGLLSGRIGPDGAAVPGSRMDQAPAFRDEFVSPGRLEIAGAVAAIARERNRTPSQIALAWLLARPGVTAPIVGVRTEEQLEENLAAVDLKLDEEATRRLEEVSALELTYPYDHYAAVQGLIASLNLRRGSA
jgi:aryl-alcohol dehydrogenase-like predicted oxidoreductase